MNDKHITGMRVDLRHPPSGETDWGRVRAMTDDEALRDAEEDPDCPPMEMDQQGSFRTVVQPQWLRRRLGMSQQTFADTFGFSVRSLRAWEQGRSQPGRAIRAYLRVIAVNPEAVMKALTREKPVETLTHDNTVPANALSATG